jgi:hypothetical protein
MATDRFDYDDDELEKEQKRNTRGRKFTDFDCPSCNANNPRDEKFGDGDEVMCFYCGCDYRARVSDEGRLQLKEL